MADHEILDRVESPLHPHADSIPAEGYSQATWSEYPRYLPLLFREPASDVLLDIQPVPIVRNLDLVYGVRRVEQHSISCRRRLLRQEVQGSQVGARWTLRVEVVRDQLDLRLHLELCHAHHRVHPHSPLHVSRQ